MYKKILISVSLIVLIVFTVTVFMLAQELTPKQKEDKAVKMINKAIAYYNKVGKDKAFKDFQNDEKWIEDEFYLFIVDYKCNCLVHSLEPNLVGHDVTMLKDYNGKMFMKEMLNLVKSKGEGWIEYNWIHPKSKRYLPMGTFTKKIPNMDAFIACCYWK